MYTMSGSVVKQVLLRIDQLQPLLNSITKIEVLILRVPKRVKHCI